MLSIGENTASQSLRRLQVLNRIMGATSQLPPMGVKRTYASLTPPKLDEKSPNLSEKKFVRIGDQISELKPVKCAEKVPRGYLGLFNSVLTDSQTYLKSMRWLMQKDALNQDAFLIGSPPNAYRRHLALAFAELLQRECEYLCLTRDTTEADIKQRREIINSSVVYVDQCAVRAALNGRILIIEGIEKAERNLLPILNNLLENREMNLDDGRFLVAPQRFDKLSNGVDLSSLKLLRVHEDFRVIAIGLPVPKYKGNLLDPPLRSRFQAHLVSLPDYADYLKYLSSSNRRVDEELLKSLCNLAYSFYSDDIQALNLPDFPVENVDKLARIMNNCHENTSTNKLYDRSLLNTGNLLNKLYPFEVILKDEETNKKFYFDLLDKFSIPEPTGTNSIDYELVNVEDVDKGKRVIFRSENGKEASVLVKKGLLKSRHESKFIMNESHSSQLVDMMLNHSSDSDFCLIGAQGSGKTELIKKFAQLLDYRVQTLYLYKDMSSRDLVQSRVTLESGDTKWHNSPLIEAAINGDLAILDGIHRIKDDTLMSLRRLIQDRELELPDGSRLLNHDKYDALMSETSNLSQAPTTKIYRIHPSFRIIATADPPNPKETTTTTTTTTSSNNSNKPQSTSDWLTSEVLNLFLYEHIAHLNLKHERFVLERMFTRLNESHEKLLDVLEAMKERGRDDVHLRHVAKLFSLRKVIRLAKKLSRYPEMDLRVLIENECLFKFMPQLNKEILLDFFDKYGLKYSEANTSSDESKLVELMNFKSKDISLDDQAKIPETVFFDNALHIRILNNMSRDFSLGEHLLLIGNQGTGKNKLTDRFLQLTSRPREYIQLHRDTTVHSLTLQPVIERGIVRYEDSPLVKAVRFGRVLVVDEADKAPLHVTCVLKSLIESGEMQLSDGRKIVPSDYEATKSEEPNLVRMHKNFRMIILANRFSFPFLGNDFFMILGDLLACHPIDNPDPQSEIQMLRKYGPNVPESVLEKLVSAFGSLRQLSDQGLISYPYSTRELVNIVKHLEKYPDEPLASVLANVHDFDHFSEQNDLKQTFREVMRKHGIPLDSKTFQINLAKPFPLPKILGMRDLSLTRLDHDVTSRSTLSRLSWKRSHELPSTKIVRSTIDRAESRVDNFSELRSTWQLSKQQQLITDMVATSNNADYIYVCGIKPISLSRLNVDTNELIEIDLSDLFQSAWRMYYPRLKLLRLNDEPQSVLLYEETSDVLFKINFDTFEVSTIDKSVLKGSSLINTAKKAINKYFADQNNLFKTVPISTSMFASYRLGSNLISLLDLAANLDVTLNLDSDTRKVRISHLTPLSSNEILVTYYDGLKWNNGAEVRPKDLDYFIIRFPASFNSLSDDFGKQIELFNIDEYILGHGDDLVVGSVEIREGNMSRTFAEKSLGVESPTRAPFILPSVQNHFVAVAEEKRSFACRRETSMRANSDYANSTLQSLIPNLKSVIDFDRGVMVTQLSQRARPSRLEQSPSNLIGYLEYVDLLKKEVKYLEVVAPLSAENQKRNEPWRSYVSFSNQNEAEFLFDMSSRKNGVLYTLDFNGGLSAWETSQIELERSLDQWQKLVMAKQVEGLKLETFALSPNQELRDFKGPKHGKVDPENTPHVGGNTWAGGSGGFDTAGLGGVGGPYRLASGHQVYQVSDQMKQSVPEHVRKAARELGQKAFRERLREIQMTPFEHELYMQYYNNVKKPIQQLRNILEGLEAKKKERQWLKNQIDGDLDDQKLVEAITGEKNVYRRRGEDPNADSGHNMEKPKRLRLVVDVSGSMYRFNGVDMRLERELESVLMVMEAFKGFESKIVYDVVGHSGDGYHISIVDKDTSRAPKNEADRLKVVKTMIAHSQFCSSGDHTFEATKHAIKEIGKEEADDYFVIVLSDANFDRYGLSPKSFSRILIETDPKVNAYCIFIGTLGDQAAYLKKNLPFNKAFVCMDTQQVPKIMQQIFQSSMLN